MMNDPSSQCRNEERERPKISETNAPANGVSKTTRYDDVPLRQVVTHTRDATAHRGNYLDKG